MEMIVLAWEWALLTIQLLTALAVFFTTILVFVAAVWWAVGCLYATLIFVLGR